MGRKIIIDAVRRSETRLAVIDAKGKLEDISVEFAARKTLRGNVYLARVTRVEPSLQAAFVEYGGCKHGFLALDDIHPDYFQIPVDDRDTLKEICEREIDAHEKLARARAVLNGRDERNGHAKSTAKNSETVNSGTAEASTTETTEETAFPEEGKAQHQPSTDSHWSVCFSLAQETPTPDAAAPRANGNASVSLPFFPLDQADDAMDAFEPGAIIAPASGVNTAAFDGGTLLESRPAPSGAVALLPDDAPLIQGDTITPSWRLSRWRQHGRRNLQKRAFLPLWEAGPLLDRAPARERQAQKRKRELQKQLLQARQAYQAVLMEKQKITSQYKIHEVIKKNQVLLVQVTKDERGVKGAALTTYLSLAGHFCVLMPNDERSGGISRKITQESERSQMRDLLDSFETPRGMGLIMRTAGMKNMRTDIERDFQYLMRLWEMIRKTTLESIAPCLLYEEADLVKQALRDHFAKDIENVVIEGDAAYEKALTLIKMITPADIDKIIPYRGKQPIFSHFRVEMAALALNEAKVTLPSGGYIIIDHTEALISIDVNSGRSTAERNVEETALSTNLEAAEEIARQCLLRDLSGLIVVDFIDMNEQRHNRAVEKQFKKALKPDQAHLRVSRISSLGLLEISRQRRRTGLWERTTSACPHCDGTGYVLLDDVMAARVLRAAESQLSTRTSPALDIITSPRIGLYILNELRHWLQELESRFNTVLRVKTDPHCAALDYSLRPHKLYQES